MVSKGFSWADFQAHAPNVLQLIDLDAVNPSPENCRLFIEWDSLHKLRDVYAKWARGEQVILPDAPILRYQGQVNGVPKLEILAGERRITAAIAEGVKYLPCRVVSISMEEAYRLILEHNEFGGLTTAELAFRAAEMERLGFSADEISHALGGVATYRYLTVGRMIEAGWFTDEPKLCNPNIVEWYEAAVFGPDHLRRCFEMWNAGLWDEAACAKHFRNRGTSLPQDNAEKGIRLTLDGERLVLRGQIHLDFTSPQTAGVILDRLITELMDAKATVTTRGYFGDERVVLLFNPETVGLS